MVFTLGYPTAGAEPPGGFATAITLVSCSQS
jgi:hypothetical protein